MKYDIEKIKEIVRSKPDTKIIYFWGHTQTEEDDCSMFHVDQWQGENLLGCALMEVRDWLMEIEH